MLRTATVIALVLLIVLCSRTPVQGQLYMGVLGGVSSLSGDARSTFSSASSAFSSYDPKNGGAFEVLVGKHLSDYFTVQGNYIWNANELTVSSGSFSNNEQIGYQQTRSSSQNTLIAAVLVYLEIATAACAHIFQLAPASCTFPVPRSTSRNLLEGRCCLRATSRPTQLGCMYRWAWISTWAKVGRFVTPSVRRSARTRLTIACRLPPSTRSKTF